jgi:hypothetical protein
MTVTGNLWYYIISCNLEIDCIIDPFCQNGFLLLTLTLIQNKLHDFYHAVRGEAQACTFLVIPKPCFYILVHIL